MICATDPLRSRESTTERVVGSLLLRLREVTLLRRIADVKSRLQRSDPSADPDGYRGLFEQLVALEEQRRALESTYLASRRSRDTIAERFRVASGTLFDVIGAEDSYFETAVGYLQAVTELDASRYVLLSRTGQLLPTLGITDPSQGRQP